MANITNKLTSQKITLFIQDFFEKSLNDVNHPITIWFKSLYNDVNYSSIIKNVKQKNWKRISKKRNLDKNYIREFELTSGKFFPELIPQLHLIMVSKFNELSHHLDSVVIYTDSNDEKIIKIEVFVHKINIHKINTQFNLLQELIYQQDL
jgi:hypothetical protein